MLGNRLRRPVSFDLVVVERLLRRLLGYVVLLHVEPFRQEGLLLVVEIHHVRTLNFLVGGISIAY